MNKTDDTISLDENYNLLTKDVGEKLILGILQWPSTKKEIEDIYNNNEIAKKHGITVKVIGSRNEESSQDENNTRCIFDVLVQGDNNESFKTYISYDIPNKMVKEDEEEKKLKRRENVKLIIMFIASIMAFKIGFIDLTMKQITPVQIEEATNSDDTTKKEEQGNFSYYLLNRKTKSMISKKNEDNSFNDNIYDNLMTTLFVMEKLTLNQREKTVTVTSSELSKVSNLEYTINLVEGEEITINCLLDALLLVSAEDAREVLKAEVEKVTGESYEEMLEKKEQLVFQKEQFSNARKLSVLMDYVINRSYIGNSFKGIVSKENYVKPITNKCKAEVIFEKMFKTEFMEREGIHIYCIYAKDNGKGACMLFCAENKDKQQIIGTVYSDNTNKNDMQSMITQLIREGFELLQAQDEIGENEGEDRS